MNTIGFNNNLSFMWNIEKLPFYYKPLDVPSNRNGIPDFMSFVLTVDKETGLIMQSANKELTDVLQSVYSDGSIPTGIMEDDGIGKEYTDDFIGYLEDIMQKESFSGIEVLEIGCGTGYLLNRLRSKGAQITGIEPRQQRKQDLERYKVPIVEDFFPSS
ncbi:class I SAM-dependent methyltransferase, partial [Elusimicrobiota bacterium]